MEGQESRTSRQSRLRCATHLQRPLSRARAGCWRVRDAMPDPGPGNERWRNSRSPTRPSRRRTHRVGHSNRPRRLRGTRRTSMRHRAGHQRAAHKRRGLPTTSEPHMKQCRHDQIPPDVHRRRVCCSCRWSMPAESSRRFLVLGGPGGRLAVVPAGRQHDTRWQKWTVLISVHRQLTRDLSRASLDWAFRTFVACGERHPAAAPLPRLGSCPTSCTRPDG